MFTFIVIALAAIVAIAVYVTRKTRTNQSIPTVVVEEPIVSIHEEIAKTVEEAKSQSPIVEEVPTMTAKPKKKAAPKKPKTPKANA